MNSSNSSRLPPFATISFIIGLIAVLLTNVLPTPKPTLLQALCKHQFEWTKSTTSIPISSVSVIAKALLSKDATVLPTAFHHLIPNSDNLILQPVRDVLNQRRLANVRALCERTTCDYNEADAEFGLTPLHVAALTRDELLTNFLTSHGAMPQEDHVGRLPLNLTFENFIANAKRARKEEQDCDFPIVDFANDVSHARQEARRLVGEGEPLLMRHAYRHYDTTDESVHWSVSDWVQRFGEVDVTVGSVPYARAFNLSTRSMKLSEYFHRFIKRKEADNVYVFNKGPKISQNGYETIGRLVEHVLEWPGLIVHPNRTGHAQGIHFSFGREGSGAPFHIHADALNGLVNGRKKWFAYTPARTVYSRKPVVTWVKEDLPRLAERERPLECVQRAGDVVYIPLDWGHAILNLDEHTFGYALEILNRRNTLGHITRHA